MSSAARSPGAFGFWSGGSNFFGFCHRAPFGATWNRTFLGGDDRRQITRRGGCDGGAACLAAESASCESRGYSDFYTFRPRACRSTPVIDSPFAIPNGGAATSASNPGAGARETQEIRRRSTFFFQDIRLTRSLAMEDPQETSVEKAKDKPY